MKQDAAWIGVAAALVTITIWTAFLLVGRASAKLTLTPLDIAFLRMVGGVCVLAPLGWWWVHRRAKAPKTDTEAVHLSPNPRSSTHWLGLSPLPLGITCLLGLFGELAYAPLAYSGFFFAPAAHGAVLISGALPLLTALVSLWLLGERVSKERAVGLMAVAGGGILVAGPSLWHGLQGGQVWIGDVLFLMASTCCAVYSVLARHFKVDAVEAAIAISVFSASLFVPFYGVLAWLQALPFGWVSRLGEAPWQEIASQMLMQGVGTVVISGISFMLMLKHFGAVRSTMMTALVPSLASLAAVFVLNEPLHWNVVVGLLLALLGVMLGVMPRGQPLQQLEGVR